MRDRRMSRVEFIITTDSGGAATLTKSLGPHAPFLLYAVEWVDTDFDAGVDATLSYDSPSGISNTLLTLSNADAEARYYPRVLEDDVAGADLTGVYCMQVVDGTLRLVIASGGNVKTGKMIVYLLEP